MVRPLTEHLVECLMLDVWPRPAAIVDFGIDSSDHLGALQNMVKNGVTAEALDEALGNGPKLTLLARRHGGAYGNVVFSTSYDFMLDEEDDEE